MNFELQILDWFQTLHTPVGDFLMKGITHLGDAGIFWILLTIGLLIYPKTRRTGGIMAIALVLDVIICNGILKNLVARTRPYEIRQGIELLIARPHDYSFPSGHTAASFASVTALYAAGEKKLWKPALVLAILIAISRMYFYVHFPTDILGGAIVGSLCGLAAGKLAEYFNCRKDDH